MTDQQKYNKAWKAYFKKKKSLLSKEHIFFWKAFIEFERKRIELHRQFHAKLIRNIKII